MGKEPCVGMIVAGEEELEKGQQGSTVKTQQLMDIWRFVDGTGSRAVWFEGGILERVVFVKSGEEGRPSQGEVVC